MNWNENMAEDWFQEMCRHHGVTSAVFDFLCDPDNPRHAAILAQMQTFGLTRHAAIVEFCEDYAIDEQIVRRFLSACLNNNKDRIQTDLPNEQVEYLENALGKHFRDFENDRQAQISLAESMLFNIYSVRTKYVLKYKVNKDELTAAIKKRLTRRQVSILRALSHSSLENPMFPSQVVDILEKEEGRPFRVAEAASPLTRMTAENLVVAVKSELQTAANLRQLRTGYYITDLGRARLEFSELANELIERMNEHMRDVVERYATEID